MPFLYLLLILNSNVHHSELSCMYMSVTTMQTMIWNIPNASEGSLCPLQIDTGNYCPDFDFCHNQLVLLVLEFHIN